LWLAALAGTAAAENATAPAMRDATTHDQLAAKHRTEQQPDPMLALQPAKGPDPTKTNRVPDLLADSDIVCFGGRATLVPKQAILHVPPNFAERLKFQPGAKIQNWAEFYVENRGWITTVEVTRVQAEGNQPMDEATCKRVADSSSLVVATYQGGPISVLPPKAPPPPPALPTTGIATPTPAQAAKP
jgi:hypothetical protein